MIVELVQTWFASSPKITINKGREISGRRWRPGVHTMPDSLYSSLPTSAKIIEPPNKLKNDGEKWVAKRKWTIDKEHDDSLEARGMDQLQEAHDEAEVTRKAARVKILERARAKKAQNKLEREAAEAELTKE